MSGETQYDLYGNITWREGLGTYGYDANRIHAVRTVGSNLSYTYDDAGRVLTKTHGSTTTHVDWTSFGKPRSINKANSDDQLYFTYDAANSRIHAYSREGNITRSKWMVGGYELEKLTEGGVTSTVSRHYISGPNGVLGTHTEKTAPSGSKQSEVRFFLNDHLGSLVATVDHAFVRKDEFAHDAWGQRIQANNWSADANWEHNAWTGDRGFTGHEMLNTFELVHMNGRIYDPTIGRFISADPFIQFEGNIQSYNRYSYVLNNPLRYTDPSGYLIPLIATLVAVAAQAPAWVVAIVAAVSTTLYAIHKGASLSQALRAGVIAGVQSYVISSIGDHFNGLQDTTKSFNWAVELKRAAAKGVAGGAFSAASGGDFKSGFLGGFAGSLISSSMAASDTISGFMGKAGDGDFAGIIGRTTIAAVAGGTVSVIGGGKFANGAYTAAFQHLANSETSAQGGEAPSVDLTVEDAAVLLQYGSEHLTNEQIAFLSSYIEANSSPTAPYLYSERVEQNTRVMGGVHPAANFISPGPAGPLKGIGTAAKNTFKWIKSGKSGGYIQFFTHFKASQSATSVFSQLTGRNPSRALDIFESDTLRVIYRQTSKSGGETIEVVNHLRRTIEKIHVK